MNIVSELIRMVSGNTGNLTKCVDRQVSWRRSTKMGLKFRLIQSYYTAELRPRKG